MPDIKSLLLLKLEPSGSPERCGVISTEGEVVELTNAHVSPQLGFQFSAADTFEWLASGKAAATWHTHPGEDPNLSEEDYAGFLQWPELTHWIVGLREEPLAIPYTISAGLVLAG